MGSSCNPGIGAAFWHVQARMPLCAEFDADPLAEGRRVDSQINDNVIYRSGQASDRLRFNERLRLEVKATQSAFHWVAGDEAVFNVRGNAVLLEFSFIKDPFQFAPAVSENTVLNSPDTTDR